MSDIIGKYFIPGTKYYTYDRQEGGGVSTAVKGRERTLAEKIVELIEENETVWLVRVIYPKREEELTILEKAEYENPTDARNIVDKLKELGQIEGIS